MYDDQFGLTGRPFALTPDPELWFESATHRKAMTYLRYGLSQGEGFVVVTGEIGSGKTTLVARLVDDLDDVGLRVLSLPSARFDADELLRAVARGLNVSVDGGRSSVLAGVTAQLLAEAREGRRVLLIVDEAQALDSEALEELRALSNLQLGSEPLVQVVLTGQPELRDRLATDPMLEQFRQRVVASHHLGAMQPDEVGPYLIHRLGGVGWTGTPDFTDAAVTAIDDWSDGLPRRVNLLAHRLLMAAALEEVEVIDDALVERVVADLAADQPADRAGGSPATDEHQSGRVDRLEVRLDEQDETLRRALALMVELLDARSGTQPIGLRDVA